MSASYLRLISTFRLSALTVLIYLHPSAKSEVDAAQAAALPESAEMGYGE